MTSHPLPPAAPLTIPDLWREHERVQRQFMIGKVVALGAAAVLGLFMGLLAWATLGGLAGAAFGLVSLMLFLLVIALGVVLSAAKERRYAGPAGKGPSSFGQVLTSAPGSQVWTAAYAALAAEKFGPPRAIDPQTVVTTRSLSMASWGETLTIRIAGTPDGRGLVTVWSRPAYPLQWLDYGRNRRYANAVLRAIPGATPVT